MPDSLPNFKKSKEKEKTKSEKSVKMIFKKASLPILTKKKQDNTAVVKKTKKWKEEEKER